MVATLPGVSRTATHLIALLQPYTPFAEAIIRRQAERAGLDLAHLSTEHVATLGPMIVKAAATFVDPSVLERLKRQVMR
ncbi:MAG: hypothetical protein QM820_64760 [Minicystis sp.]